MSEQMNVQREKKNQTVPNETKQQMRPCDYRGLESIWKLFSYTI